MKILLFSDLHVQKYEQFATILPNGRNSRLQDCLDIIKQASDICLKERVQYTIFAGDLFDSWRSLDVETLVLTYKAMGGLAMSCESLFLLKGNHDCYDSAGNITILDIFDYATPITEPQVRFMGGITIAFQPYTNNEDNFKEFVKHLPDGVDLFIFHQPFKEAVLPGSNLLLNKGMSLDELPHKRVKLCIGGDIHKWQLLRRNIIYLGSPLQLDFSESEEQKGFTLLDTDTWNVRFIPTIAPKFYTFTALQFKHVNRFFDIDKDFIRVTCTTQEEAKQLKQEYPRIQTTVLEKFEFKQRIKEGINDEDLLEEYVKRTAKDLGQDRLIQQGIQFLQGEKREQLEDTESE
jgi:DNA repair exonuclease SbcCD nuclease subunit